MSFSKFENHPDDMERITCVTSPIVSMKYEEAAAQGRGFYINVCMNLRHSHIIFYEITNISPTTT